MAFPMLTIGGRSKEEERSMIFMPHVNKETVAYANKKRYISEYNKKEYMNMSLSISKTRERDIIEKLNSQPSRASYIKGLIREDINKAC